jgi:hypothetical protein
MVPTVVPPYDTLTSSPVGPPVTLTVIRFTGSSARSSTSARPAPRSQKPGCPARSSRV